jgi:hypothetical protein
MKGQKGWNPGKINRQQDRSSPILPDHVVPSGHCLYKIYSFRTTLPYARTSHLIWVCTWVRPGTTLKDNEIHMIWFSYFVFFELSSSIRLVQMCNVFWYDVHSDLLGGELFVCLVLVCTMAPCWW